MQAHAAYDRKAEKPRASRRRSKTKPTGHAAASSTGLSLDIDNLGFSEVPAAPLLEAWPTFLRNPVACRPSPLLPKLSHAEPPRSIGVTISSTCEIPAFGGVTLPMLDLTIAVNFIAQARCRF